MRTFRTVEEIQACVGEHMGYTDWVSITQHQINLFADATNDHQWIHVDPERAAKGPFGKTIAHGYLTLSMVPTMVEQLYVFEGFKMILNYGSGKVRFPAPCPVDSRFRTGVLMKGVTETKSGVQVLIEATCEIEGGTRPVCVAEVIYLVVP